MSGAEAVLPDKGVNPQAEPIVATEFVPNEIDLFMFCAATWNTHRIHYDRAFAEASGFRDLVVPGPLQTARLAQMLSDFAGRYDGRLTTMSVRHRASIYCNEPVYLSANLVAIRELEGAVAIDVSVAVKNASEVTATSGQASLTLVSTDQVEELVRTLRGEVA